ncbi:MAG: hypothetical protein ABIQ07_04450 [Ginsengibacter sp.]
MLFWNKICGIISIIFFTAITCNAQVPDTGKNLIAKTYKYNFSRPLALNNINSNNKYLSPFTVIPQDYYTQHFGIMCKKELAIEKATKIPFRFRIGSLQQCNYLEGKK